MLILCEIYSTLVTVTNKATHILSAQASRKQVPRLDTATRGYHFLIRSSINVTKISRNASKCFKNASEEDKYLQNREILHKNVNLLIFKLKNERVPDNSQLRIVHMWFVLELLYISSS